MTWALCRHRVIINNIRRLPQHLLTHQIRLHALKSYLIKKWATYYKPPPQLCTFIANACIKNTTVAKLILYIWTIEAVHTFLATTYQHRNRAQLRQYCTQPSQSPQLWHFHPVKRIYWWAWGLCGSSLYCECTPLHPVPSEWRAKRKASQGNPFKNKDPHLFKEVHGLSARTVSHVAAQPVLKCVLATQLHLNEQACGRLHGNGMDQCRVCGKVLL